jgi:predicted XRE-type DNA-binding protein
MKVRSVQSNNRRKGFEVDAYGKEYFYPYSRLSLPPTARDRVQEAYVDGEIDREGFTYALESGSGDTVHIDQVLEYNQDPSYLRDLLLYKLTIEAQQRIESSPLSKREIIRRLGTSATQFYRLLDQTNTRKSIDKMVTLLYVLDCEVELVVRERGDSVQKPGPKPVGNA